MAPEPNTIYCRQVRARSTLLRSPPHTSPWNLMHTAQAAYETSSYSFTLLELVRIDRYGFDHIAFHTVQCPPRQRPREPAPPPPTTCIYELKCYNSRLVLCFKFDFQVQAPSTSSFLYPEVMMFIGSNTS